MPLLRDVAAGQQAWPAFLEALSASLHGAALVLIVGDADSVDAAPSVETAGIAEPFRSMYVDGFAFRDPWAERLDRLPAGTVGFGYETLPRALLTASRFYADWMHPQGLAVTPTIHAVVAAGCDGIRALLAVFRRADGPSLELEDVALIRDLIPELRRAVQAQRHRSPHSGRRAPRPT